MFRKPFLGLTGLSQRDERIVLCSARDLAVRLNNDGYVASQSCGITSVCDGALRRVLQGLR